MKLKKLEAICFTILFLSPAFILAQTQNVNESHAGNVNPSVSERTIPDINNPAARGNLSSPNENTDGALVDQNNPNGQNVRGMNSNVTNFSRDTWRQVQDRLNDSNFPVGTADGLSGPRTTEALRNYQRSQNLEVTGRLNQETLDAMGIDYNIPTNNMNQEYSE